MNQRTNYPSQNALLENFQPIIRVENQPIQGLEVMLKALSAKNLADILRDMENLKGNEGANKIKQFF